MKILAILVRFDEEKCVFVEAYIGVGSLSLSFYKRHIIQ